MKLLTILFSLIFLSACITSRTYVKTNPEYEAALTDSLLAYALDHEAIYTLLDTLKPISSVKSMRYKIATDSNDLQMASGHITGDSALKKLKAYQRICKELSHSDWQFVAVPFASVYDEYRYIEIYVVRKSQFRKLLGEKEAFFGQWGFTTESNPATVLPVVEYEKKYNRFRAYGYLFGYPDYAVDFFVNASVLADKDTSIRLVPRDFFAIPVFAGEEGYFTYAMPKKHEPTSIDSSLYKKAVYTLDRYKSRRANYVNKKGGFSATQLWHDWNKDGRKPRSKTVLYH